MLRRIALGILLLLLLTATALGAVRYHADKHFYDGYMPCRPLNAAVSEAVEVQGEVKAFKLTMPTRYRRIALSFDSQTGERVPAILTMPFDAPPDKPVPVIVLLHGSHQEKEFVEQICTPFNEAGFAMACFDQYMRGERKVTGSVTTVALAFRERCRKTVLDSRRLIDYLQTRSDIDGSRIYLIGASYGAITGTVVAAQEKRIRAAALVVGGGNFRLLAKAPEVRRELPRWMWPIAGLMMTTLAGVADPLHHAAGTAGMPILMLNGSKDGVVTPESGEALFAALGEPKEIRWYPVDHPDREPNGEEVHRMLSDGLKWFLDIDAPYREAPQEDVVAAETVEPETAEPQTTEPETAHSSN